MTLRMNGSTSGYTEIDAPAVAGSNTLVLPGGNGTADQALVTNGSGTLSFADRGRMVLETAQASTSGTSVDFTGIPSWVKRVTVMFDGVSTNGASSLLSQLGTNSGIVATGYIGSGMRSGAAALVSANFTTGMGLNTINPSSTHSGQLIWTNVSSNTWIGSGVLGENGNPGVAVAGSSVTLSATLDRLRITTVNGTDTFDAGSINLLLEG